MLTITCNHSIILNLTEVMFPVSAALPLLFLSIFTAYQKALYAIVILTNDYLWKFFFLSGSKKLKKKGLMIDLVSVQILLCKKCDCLLNYFGF